eukprot:Skav228264  [mRNA]  locus=scaffold2995:26279:27763:- [translate_table: standard]
MKSDDPWLKQDPWATPSSAKQKQCRWEDLCLPDDHCFFSKAKERVPQVHRLQLSPNLGGVAFTTKSNVEKIFIEKPKSPFALLIPVSENLRFDSSLNINISNPVEAVVRDPVSNEVYKRQMLILQVGDDIIHHLQSPAYSGTLQEMQELVLELHKSLVSKEIFNFAIDKPLDQIKNRLQDQLPSAVASSLHLYGVRMIRDAERKVISIQCLCKVSIANRSVMLERSGVGDLLIRDFFDRSSKIQDTTILPRFWAVDRAGKDQILRLGNGVTGYAGIVCVKRGLAIRAWCDKLRDIRKVVLPGDERLTESNRHIIPRVTLEAKGWPFSVAPTQVISAVEAATGLTCIPCRCYKSVGVTTWTIALEKAPTTCRFTVSFSGVLYEILITEPASQAQQQQRTAKISKGKGKGKANNNQASSSSGVAQSIVESQNERLAKLESKMSSVEKRQDSIENKLSEGFLSVNDQLRQLLQIANPKQAQHPQTGMTPPPKAAKLS